MRYCIILIATLALFFCSITSAHAFDIQSTFYNSQTYIDSDGNATVGPNSLASIYNPLIKFVFILGGLMVLAGFIWGGFTIISNSGNPQKVAEGQTIITSTVLGLALLFSIYWIVQLVEMLTGLNILNPNL